MVRGGGKPQLVTCITHPLPDNTPEGWKILARDLHLSRTSTLMLLAPSEYQLIQVDAPSVPESEIKAAVRWKLKDILNFPLEQATVDVINIPTDQNAPGRARFVYAVAARNEVIKRCVDNSQAAGVDLEVIDIPEMAQRNIATFLEESGRGVALLTFNDDGGLLTFTAGGELYHARQIELTAPQFVVEDAAQRQRNFERLGLVLQRSFDSFERQLNYITLARLVLGPMLGQSALEEYLRANLDIPVVSLDLTEVVNFAAVKGLNDPAMQAQCLHAIGAALREEGGT
ncbi:MAG: agglutinin biogenesis protein MshI [Nitrosomonadales bacterium]|nr:MAG: agglutinin biogenesis protein MshI [Nitrosomonadales bacterium]